MPDSQITAIITTALPDTACAEEQREFQRGLQLIAELVTQQSYAPSSPILVQAMPESDS